MTPEAEAAKARVLMEYKERLNGFVPDSYLALVKYLTGFEEIGASDNWANQWLSADLENNKRIVREKWPDAVYKGVLGGGDGIWTDYTLRVLLANGANEPEAWLNARKIVRGEV